MVIIILWYFSIIKPFILITVWATILAVALYPLHEKLTTLLKGNKKIASTIVGLMVADIPGAGIWAIAVLILAIAQLPPILILGPIAAYYFSVADTTPAVIFLIFSIIVSASDAFLKPLFLGRGMSIPMMVILLGAIGGMLLSGIIGLFVGAVVLALGYELMMDWLSHTPENKTEESDSEIQQS
jgi:predicted PurR-regulated permease PerM